MIKNKLHEYLRSKNTCSNNHEPTPEELDEEGLTIDEFIELFKDVATRPEVYFTLGEFSPLSEISSCPAVKIGVLLHTFDWHFLGSNVFFWQNTTIISL